MTPTPCEHEHVVVAAGRAGHWPAECDAALRAHVAACADCDEALAVAQLLEEADRGLDVAVPSAGQMWWRLAVRARVEREQAAARPVVWSQGLAAACGVGFGVAALGQLRPALTTAVTAVTGRVSDVVPAAIAVLAWPDLAGAGPFPGVVAAAGVALLVLCASGAFFLWAGED